MHFTRSSTLLPFMLAALAVSASAFAQTPPTNPMFDHMDTNHDGRISREEHATAALATFKGMDTNGDGKLSADEFAAVRQAITGQTNDAAANDNNAVAKTLFERLDANHDGVVSEEEMRAAHNRPPVATTEKIAPVASKTPAQLRGMAAVLDTNHDGVVSASEHATAARARFDRMDTNHDGFVSRQEMDAARAAKAPATGH